MLQVTKRKNHMGYIDLQPKYYFNFHEWVDLFITLYMKEITIVVVVDTKICT